MMLLLFHIRSYLFIVQKKKKLLIYAICVLFLLSSRLRMSFVSAVFDFNASLRDVAPVSSMLLSVDFDEKKECTVSGRYCVPFFVRVYDSDRVL